MTRKYSFTRTALSVSALTILFTSALLYAGPLTPPAGPVAPTAKPLSEVEPRIAINATNTPGDADSSFKITQPGSYYLTGNVTGVVGKHGIEIANSGVTLDLNGFELRGVGGSLDGINVSTSRGRNIVVKNGSLRSWGDCGLECEFNADNPPSIMLVDVRAALNTRHGLATQGDTQMRGCRAEENGGSGLLAVGSSSFTGCVSISNSVHGFEANAASILTECVASINSQRGFYTALGSTLRNCTASNNQTGFVSQGTLYEGCNAYDNFGTGFDLFTGCTLKACNAYRNGGVGIDASTNALVVNCTSQDNDGVGISVATATQVIGCTVSDNAGHGIVLASNASARDNSVFNNGGTTATFANISVTGPMHASKGTTAWMRQLASW
ncbi:right-handed parallel beta-helix repeat-containing protein [Synechococcus sp. Cruz CV-v-12]|uniref:right-handed parallel beta-helix repeat-containing protein n=1 Tax=Synechococcus sp. Cruz CV-v-12 TaxID=2823728 RepID=UPI0020CF77E6|nr:right-handed parallel beta-helix repeat-containing protein [Synechococcus sp. Cruz CV-v-12]MCP9874369.1 right-handed parallel beta-helix repeat-containing protein [Synechococcus sp. Cruz CV-v-12]